MVSVWIFFGDWHNCYVFEMFFFSACLYLRPDSLYFQFALSYDLFPRMSCRHADVRQEQGMLDKLSKGWFRLHGTLQCGVGLGDGASVM